MSLDPPTYLSSLQNNIRARPIPWEGAVRAGTITDNDLKTIKAVDKVRKEQRKQTVENDIESYQSLILGGDKGKSVLDSASKRSDVIQYMLVLTGDLINGISSTPTRTVVCLGVLTVEHQMFPVLPPSSSSIQNNTNLSCLIYLTPPIQRTQYHYWLPLSSPVFSRQHRHSRQSQIQRQTKRSKSSTNISLH